MAAIVLLAIKLLITSILVLIGCLALDGDCDGSESPPYVVIPGLIAFAVMVLSTVALGIAGLVALWSI